MPRTNKIETISKKRKKSTTNNKEKSLIDDLVKIKRKELPTPRYSLVRGKSGIDFVLAFRISNNKNDDDNLGVILEGEKNKDDLYETREKRKSMDKYSKALVDQSKTKYPPLIFEREKNLSEKMIANDLEFLEANLEKDIVNIKLTKHICYLIKNFYNSILGKRYNLPVDTCVRLTSFIFSYYGDCLRERPQLIRVPQI